VTLIEVGGGMLAVGVAPLNEGLMLALQTGGDSAGSGGGYGPWATVINILRGLVLVCGSLGVVLGLVVKSVAATSAEAQELGNQIIVRALAGLMLGLLAEAAYRLIVGWTT
jgi:hypothetical protein